MDTIYIDNNFDNIFSIHATFKNYVNGYERKKEKSLWAEAVTLGTVAHQSPPSMEFSRQEYWSR